MYQAGDRIVYGSSGVCVIEKVDVPDFKTFSKGKPYYFLTVEEDGSRIYAPVDTKTPIRLLASREQALALMAHWAEIPVDLPASRDHKVISAHFHQLLQQHTLHALACTVKSLLCKKGIKRLTAPEEDILKKAESLLYSELADALGQSRNSIQSTILEASRLAHEKE